MLTTTNYAFPYPALSDSPNGPTQIGNLASAVDTSLFTVETKVNKYYNVPRANVRQATIQSIADSTFVSLTFDASDLDLPSAGHSNSTNNSRYTCYLTGQYRLSGLVCFSSNATGVRGCHWAKNGTAVNATTVMLPACGGGVSTRVPASSIIIQLTAGDYVELQAFQTAGGALNTLATADNASSMAIDYVGF